MLKKLKRTLYLGGVYSIGSLFERGLSFIFIPVYTAYLGTVDYGIVGIMSVTVGFLANVIATPLENGFVRFYHSPEYRSQREVLLFNILILGTFQAAVLAAVFWSFSSYLAALLLKDPQLSRLVSIYALILFFEPISGLLLTFIRQEEKARFFVIVSWTRIVLTAGGILGMLIVLDLGVLALIYGNLIGVAFTVAAVCPVLWKYATPRFSLKVLKPALQFGYPLILRGLSIYLIQFGDRYVLMIFTTLSVVGVYSFGYKFASILSIILVVPLKRALQPLVLQQEATPDKLRAFVSRNCRYYYLAGMFLCLFLSLYAGELIRLLASSPGFWESWIVVPLIAFSYLLKGLGNFSVWGMNMAKKPYHISATVLVSALVNVGLNFMLIPRWGMMGAAWATIAAYVLHNGLNIYLSGKYYDLDLDLPAILRITAVGAMIYGISRFFGLQATSWVNAVLKLILLMSYPLFFIAMGFFDQTERIYFHKIWQNLKRNGLQKTLHKVKR